MSTPLIYECEHCDHAPFKSKKNLNIHVRNPRPALRRIPSDQSHSREKFDLDDPEDGGSGDEPTGVREEEPVNIALDYLFDDFYDAVMAPDNDEAPVAGSATEPDAANTQAGPTAGSTQCTNLKSADKALVPDQIFT